MNDLGFHEDKFTCYNNGEGREFIKEGLDNVLGNIQWIEFFKDTKVNTLAAQTSNHIPLLITVNFGQ